MKRGPGVKHTSLRPPGGQRFLRLDSLGEGYSESGLQARMAAAQRGGNTCVAAHGTGRTPAREILPPAGPPAHPWPQVPRPPGPICQIPLSAGEDTGLQAVQGGGFFVARRGGQIQPLRGPIQAHSALPDRDYGPTRPIGRRAPGGNRRPNGPPQSLLSTEPPGAGRRYGHAGYQRRHCPDPLPAAGPRALYAGPRGLAPHPITSTEAPREREGPR
ncbi:hypothetical protein SRB521_01186 [Intestinimonas butyriciproducens]|nr:hypothetical protein SRB521_01186 [Intestinimonas butyriciproducens]